MKYHPPSSHLLLKSFATPRPGVRAKVRTPVLPHWVAPCKSHLTSSEPLSPLWKKCIKWDSLSYFPAKKIWFLPLTKKYSLTALLKLTILRTKTDMKGKIETYWSGRRAFLLSPNKTMNTCQLDGMTKHSKLI